MKVEIALIGTGKTGSEVAKILRENNIALKEFNSKSVLSFDTLKKFQVIICFVPTHSFSSLLSTLLETKVPVICGTTGIDWTKEIREKIQESKTRWIYAHNFSLGMNLIHRMIDLVERSSHIFTDMELKLHEVHHKDKKDAPSGTALNWAKWTKQNPEISYARKDDVVGLHELEINLKGERITLKHEALDRRVFAEGVLWALKKVLIDNEKVPYGLTNFEDLTMAEIL